eukprot:jgi/Chrzof1/12079/Cz06g20180.t1
MDELASYTAAPGSAPSRYACTDLNSPKSSIFGGTQSHGKSNHMSAVRALGLFHDLQEYVTTLEETTAEQKKQLGQLKDEKRDIEKVLMKGLHAPDKQPYIQPFQESEVANLPPRLRALFSDNKVLKEEIRKYKARVQATERQASEQEHKVQALQEQNCKLKAALQACSTSEEDVADHKKLQQQLEEAVRVAEKLQHRCGVLQLKLDTDSRSHRQALATAARERQALEQQIAALKSDIEVKDKEVRAQALTAKQAQRKLEEQKQHAAKVTATAGQRVQEAVAAEAARLKQLEDSRVHLMLCIIRDTSAAAPTGKHAPVSVCESGVVARPAPALMSTGPSRYSQEEAAVVVQAAVRGHLTRKQVIHMRHQQERAAVLIQAGARGMKARKEVQTIRQHQQEEHAVVAYSGSGRESMPGTSSSTGQQPGGGGGAADLPMELPSAVAPAQLHSRPSTTPGSAIASVSGARGAARGTSGNGQQVKSASGTSHSRQHTPAGGRTGGKAVASASATTSFHAATPATPSSGRAASRAAASKPWRANNSNKALNCAGKTAAVTAPEAQAAVTAGNSASNKQQDAGIAAGGVVGHDDSSSVPFKPVGRAAASTSSSGKHQ